MHNFIYLVPWIYGICKWYTRYWTCFSLTWFIFHHLCWFPVLNTSLCLALSISSVGGFWIAFIKRKLIIRECFPVDIYLSGISLYVIDFFTHHLPLYFHVRNQILYNTHYSWSFYECVFCYSVLGVYLYYNNPKSRYDANVFDILFGFFCANVLFIYIHVIKYLYYTDLKNLQNYN